MLMKLGCMCVHRLAWDRLGGVEVEEGGGVGVAAGKTFLIYTLVPE